MPTGTVIDNIQNARTLKLAHTAAVALNEVIVSNGLVLIAVNAALINAENIYVYMGKVTLDKAAPLVIGLGDIVYWDEADGNVNKSSSGNTMCGFCIAAAESADTTVDIFLFPDLTNLGATELANDSADGDVVAVDVLKVKTVSLTNAQIKGLAAAPKELVAAPGANKWLEFLSAQLILDYGSEVLTETDDNLAIRYTDGSGLIVSETIQTTGFIDAAADAIINAIPVKDATAAFSSAAVLNKALVLDNIGNGEFGGNATSDTLMKVRIAYREHTNPLI
jgi:predicted RecA/RadA family phage recombinase